MFIYLLTAVSNVSSIIMAINGIIACFTVRSLPFSTNQKRLQLKRKILNGIIYFSLTLAVLWLVSIIGAWIQHGWLFVEGIIKMTLPIFLIGHAPIMIYGIPRLRLIAANDNLLSIDGRTRLMHPKLVISIYAAASSTGMALYLNIFSQPVEPDFFDVLIHVLVFLFIVFIPSFFLIRRYQTAVQGCFIPSSRWKQLLHSMIPISIIIAIIGINVLMGIQASKIPASSDMMNHHHLDTGGRTAEMIEHDHHNHTQQSSDKKIEVKQLTGDISTPADKKFTLTAKQKELSLQSGKKLKTWTYNGAIAPELRVKEGEMIEIKLINQDIDKGVTIHWHGYNVPNAMDGVPGMTQNVVKIGQSFTYKFRANQVGTYWFHSHQQASEQVGKGLFGSLIVEPKKEVYPYEAEVTVLHHRWKNGTGYIQTFGNHDQEQKKQVKPGQKVRIRVINADNHSRKFLLQGADYQVISIDGVSIEQPGLISTKKRVEIPAGGRYDLYFTMPDHPVRFGIDASKKQTTPSILFDYQLQKDVPSVKGSGVFDPSKYGVQVKNQLVTTKFDREFKMIMSNEMGFFDGSMKFLWTINGEVFPNTPTFVVKKGDRVKTTFVNRSLTDHPMHLHGHHMLVLKKNGKKVDTPWKTDTLGVKPGETYEVAFIADNPGMWMDHCHNLDHAAIGMTLHLMYDNVASSYEVGTKSGNIPD